MQDSQILELKGTFYQKILGFPDWGINILPEMIFFSFLTNNYFIQQPFFGPFLCVRLWAEAGAPSPGAGERRS